MRKKGWKMTQTEASRESHHELPSTRRAKRLLSIRLKFIVPMSLIILGLIGTSLLATTWLIQRFHYDDLTEALARTAQVVETLLTIHPAPDAYAAGAVGG